MFYRTAYENDKTETYRLNIRNRNGAVNLFYDPIVLKGNVQYSYEINIPVTPTAKALTQVTPEQPKVITQMPLAPEKVKLYYTEHGTKYHREWCPYLKDKNGKFRGVDINLEDAKSRGFKPCSRCKPPINEGDK
jgi:hypothetical protein